jgi:AcrR family transcriptional regulator
MPATSLSGLEKPVRQRLTVDARREQLLAVGMDMFSTRAYDDIWIEEIADRAGVSRGLLYHYFPTKQAFYVEVTRAAAAEVRELTQPNPGLPPNERLQAGINAFLEQAEKRSEGFLTAYRGALCSDPEVRAIVEESRERQAERILAVVCGQGARPKILELAVHGWIALAQDVTAQWLEQRQPARERVSRMLLSALDGVIRAAEEAGS